MSPVPFEITSELEEGFSLPPIGDKPRAPRVWRGVRVRYRALGSRGRWRSFLLEYDSQPSLAELQEICAKHEALSG